MIDQPRDVPLDESTAHRVYDVLVQHVGARESAREKFIYSQTNRHLSEYRFMGSLGFGGKFWRTSGRRPDGSWGERWVVNQYPEDATPASRAIIEAANAELWTLLGAGEAQR